MASWKSRQIGFVGSLDDFQFSRRRRILQTNFQSRQIEPVMPAKQNYPFQSCVHFNFCLRAVKTFTIDFCTGLLDLFAWELHWGLHWVLIIIGGQSANCDQSRGPLIEYWEKLGESCVNNNKTTHWSLINAALKSRKCLQEFWLDPGFERFPFCRD